MAESIISFRNVDKSYEGNKVLKDFNLEIEAGEFITIIGSSGSGKTTVLKLVNGLLTPDAGSVLVNGQDLKTTDLISLRRNTGYVIQGIGLFTHLNVRRNITYVPFLSKKTDKRKADERAEELIEMVGLTREFLDRYPGELSGGQKQRVGIARALAASPKLLLMDEAFGAVDEITRKLLQEQIRDIYKKLHMTVLFITHDIREALKLGTRVLVMDEGKVLQSGTPDEIKNQPVNTFVAELVNTREE